MKRRVRSMILLGGVVLLVAGCMVPLYRMPAGYSGSYHRYLNGTAGISADNPSSRVPADPAAASPEIGYRPSVEAVMTGTAATQSTESTESPPIPPRS